ncbi:hypothetical protein VTI28DRAFT_5509 [Corynascus sepedonium]
MRTLRSSVSLRGHVITQSPLGSWGCHVTHKGWVRRFTAPAGRKEHLRVRPDGWGTSQEQRVRLSLLDLMVTQYYMNFGLIFRLGRDVNKAVVADILRRGLERTLGECRHLAGTIEPDDENAMDFSLVTRSDSEVPLVIHHLDEAPEDGVHGGRLSYAGLEATRFTSLGLDHLDQLTISNMTKASPCAPQDRPRVAGFQLNFLAGGGAVLSVHLHHIAADATGCAAIVRRLAAHCAHLVGVSNISSSFSSSFSTPTNPLPPPPFDHKTLASRARLLRPPVPEADLVDQPPTPPRHPSWRPCAWLLFHIPAASASELKRLAQPKQGRVSTYDAVVAFLWRLVTRHRAALYEVDRSVPALLFQSVNMRSRLNPAFPADFTGNLVCGGLSSNGLPADLPAPTVGEVAGDEIGANEAVPLSHLARVVRALTDGVTAETLSGVLAHLGRVRNKAQIHVRPDAMPPPSLGVTDCRAPFAAMRDADFGFGRPVAVRQLAGTAVMDNVIVFMCPPRHEDKGLGAENEVERILGLREGLEFMLPFEQHAVARLLADPDVGRFMEFRGFEAADLVSKATSHRSKTIGSVKLALAASA